MKKPFVGQIVHYVLNQGPNRGAHRPAVVVGVRTEHTVDLQVFSNGTKGDMPKGDSLPNVFWKPSAELDETGHSEGTWHPMETEL
jgi:hypothetical protein